MSRLILACLLALVALPAFADIVSVTWTNPTTYTNGAPLPASAITKTRVEYGTNAVGTGCVFGSKIGEVSTTGSATSVSTPDLPVGIYVFRAYTTASGVESAASLPTCKAIVQSPPNAPTGLAVTVTINIVTP